MRVDSPFLAAAVVAVAIAMLAIVTARLGRRLRLRGAGVSAVCGLAVAALATWLVGDVFALIPVDVPFAARAWFVVGVALMCGGFGIACARAAESPAHAERRHFPRESYARGPCKLGSDRWRGPRCELRHRCGAHHRAARLDARGLTG
ncbi:hypothetical protein JRG19_04550 [Pseudoclavibacter alba]|uniref:hypothetical protein n=1 Tax=Pseudoclavibacter albus TaxID=272241 RepID=UPI0019D1BFC8|nr:hypothetical protein [Pseudoclavibacter alba]MBN6777822.1 hypothetical protein [Pseudoclavibacter alba]